MPGAQFVLAVFMAGTSITAGALMVRGAPFEHAFEDPIDPWPQASERAPDPPRERAAPQGWKTVEQDAVSFFVPTVFTPANGMWTAPGVAEATSVEFHPYTLATTVDEAARSYAAAKGGLRDVQNGAPVVRFQTRTQKTNAFVIHSTMIVLFGPSGMYSMSCTHAQPTISAACGQMLGSLAFDDPEEKKRVINVVSPTDGKAYGLAVWEWPKAKAQGYRLESNDERRARIYADREREVEKRYGERVRLIVIAVCAGALIAGVALIVRRLMRAA